MSVGCNTKLVVAGVTASQPVSGSLGLLHDGVKDNEYMRLDMATLPIDLDFELGKFLK